MRRHRGSSCLEASGSHTRAGTLKNRTGLRQLRRRRRNTLGCTVTTSARKNGHISCELCAILPLLRATLTLVAARNISGDPTSQTTPASFLMERLVPRAGHSMVLDASGRNATIYVYGGQRDTRYENDLWAVRLATPRSSDDNAEDYDDDLPEVADDEDRLWRQGAVLDAPRRAIARSLIDASLLPVSPESSPSRSSSLPTILQIRRLDHRRVASSVTPPAAFTPRLSLTANRSLTLLTGLTRTGSGSAMQEVPLEGIWRKSGAETSPWEKIEEWSAGSSRSEERRPVSRFASQVRCRKQLSCPGLSLIRSCCGGSQVVYDPLRNEHYVFGGHPLNAANPDTRLADFWKLRIIELVDPCRVASFVYISLTGL